MTPPDAAVATPARRLPAAAVMLFLSVCGMAIGLAIDCGVTPPGLLAALCAASSGSLAATLSFHVAVMPASYAMMGGAAVLAVAFNEANAGRGRRTASRVAATATSVIAMLVGMFAGGWLAPDAAALLGTDPGFGLLVTGMVAGMLAATLIAAAIAYTIGAATARAERKPPQYIMYQ
jgi:hypothetical protein